MASESTLSEWNRVSLEIAARAFKYAQCSGANNQTEARSGYLKFSNLQKLHGCSTPPESAWWWIFTPLLKSLLEGVKSSGLVVALGHHTWIGPKLDDYRREWLGFLAEDFEKSENLDALVDICNYTALNNSVPEFSREDTLPTSVLLELLNKHGNSKEQIEKHPNWPFLQPLLCNFTDVEISPPNGIAWPMLIANWGELRRVIASIVASDADPPLSPPHPKGYPITKTAVKASLDSDADFFTPAIPSSFDNVPSKDFYDFYATTQNRRLKRLLDREAAKEVNLEQLLVGRPGNPANLITWVSEMPHELKVKIKDRLLRTVMWFNDFAGDPLSQGKPRMGFLLSSPVWLPPDVSGIATISMVAYLRDGVFPEKGAESPIGEAAAIVSSFRSGGAMVTELGGEGVGRSLQMEAISHELGKCLGVLSTEYDKLSTEGQTAFDYLACLEPFARCDFRQELPENLRARFRNPPDDLLKSAFHLGYYRAFRNGWVGCRHTCDSAHDFRDSLWKNRDTWIDTKNALVPDCLTYESSDEGIRAARIWLLFFLTGSFAHSLQYALSQCPYVGGWNGQPEGLRLSMIAIDSAPQGNRIAIRIENVGGKVTPPSLFEQKVSSKAVVNAFNRRRLSIQVKDHQSLGQKADGAWRWVAEITLENNKGTL